MCAKYAPGMHPNSMKTRFQPTSKVLATPSSQLTPQMRSQLAQFEKSLENVTRYDTQKFRKALDRVGLRGVTPARSANFKQSLISSAIRGMVPKEYIDILEQMDNKLLDEMFQISPKRLEAVYKYPQEYIQEGEFKGAALTVENTNAIKKMIASYKAYARVRANYAY